MKAIYPGSFYPFHFGHMDIAQRAAKIFDRVTILIAQNSAKGFRSAADVEAQKKAIQDSLIACGAAENIVVVGSFTVTAIFAKINNYDYIVRGVRGGYDLEYEFNVMTGNRIINPDLETVILPPSPQYAQLSSSLVRELWKCNLDKEVMTQLVPIPIYSWMWKLREEGKF